MSILDRYLTAVDYKVFGSRAKGTAKEYSDLDVVLIAEQPIPLLMLSKLEEAFAESDIPFKVDLVDWQRLSLEFQQKIANEWVML